MAIKRYVPLMLTLMLLAARVPANATTYALIIGVADYTQLHKLDFADKDALEFYLYLRKSVPSDAGKITIFLNKNATRNAIAGKLYEIVDKAMPGDRVFIYFSGHGDIEQLYTTDNFFLLLGKCPIKNYMTSWNYVLDRNFFDYYIQPLIAKNVRTIFICDACHSGSLIGGEKGRKNNSEAFMRSWKNEIKLLSCHPDQSSLESTKWGGGRSLFSFYLVLGIEGLADKNGNGQVSVSELQEYLDRNMSEAARDFNLPQEPEITGEKEFIISRTSPALVSQAQQQLRYNSSSGEYNKLATTKGAKVEIGNNVYIFKATGTGRSSDYFETSIENSITDDYTRSIYYEFKTKLADGQLTSSDNGSAYYYYKLLAKDKTGSPVVGEMRTTLLTAILDGYDDLLNPFYQDDTLAFGQALKAYDRNNLTIAQELAGDVKMLANPVMAKHLFLEACLPRLLTDTSAGHTLIPVVKAEYAISFLRQAAEQDPLNPSIYAKLGDLYFSERQFAAAIEEYKIYVQMLPNEEHAHKKIELALQALHQNPSSALATPR
ncbi:MAG TPA: caspase family protein [Puia sp.]|nr:caspase family protein [Puia sp.]